ncbi:MAG TPA: bis-aminopropyl spermidine synthase family protein [Longimicrobium sp.]|uniref:bis-aminopropyl spermidine synthase family protein n=1 Tax=Longimicrobium sp. TaxID=2029185 RepID=UPI002ED88EE0
MTAPGWRLRDGAILLCRGPGATLVDSVRGTVHPVPPAHAAALTRIAMRLPAPDPGGGAWDALRDAGLIHRATDDADPVLRARLEALGRGLLWKMPAGAPPALYPLALDLHAGRKAVSVDLVQGPCLPETAVRRALLLHQRHPGGRILCLGDDDLVSPLLASLGARVVVLELDEVLLEVLRSRTAARGLAVELRRQDLRDAFPADLAGGFDAVIADPVSAEPWLRLFASRAVAALRPGGELVLTAYRRREALARRLLAEMGMEEREVRLGFSHYYNEFFQHVSSWDSAMVIAARPPGAAPALEGDRRMDDDLRGFAGGLRVSYAYDFHGCEPPDGWKGAMAALARETARVFAVDGAAPCLGRAGAARTLHLAGARLVCTAVADEQAGHLAVDLLGPEEMPDKETVVGVVERLFRPRRLEYDELIRRVAGA